jgi:hypothetical protein
MLCEWPDDLLSSSPPLLVHPFPYPLFPLSPRPLTRSSARPSLFETELRAPLTHRPQDRGHPLRQARGSHGAHVVQERGATVVMAHAAGLAGWTSSVCHHAMRSSKHVRVLYDFDPALRQRPRKNPTLPRMHTRLRQTSLPNPIDHESQRLATPWRAAYDIHFPSG